MPDTIGIRHRLPHVEQDEHPPARRRKQRPALLMNGSGQRRCTAAHLVGRDQPPARQGAADFGVELIEQGRIVERQGCVARRLSAVSAALIVIMIGRWRGCARDQASISPRQRTSVGHTA
jgi:hypothetical protein